MNFIDIKNLKIRTNLFFLRVARHVIISLFFLFLVSVSVCLFVFYVNYYLVNREPIDISGGVTLKESTYDEIKNVWDENTKKFDQTSNNQYKDIFGPVVIPAPVMENIEKKDKK